MAKQAITANVLCSYWISSRDRIMNQFVVWNSVFARNYRQVYDEDPPQTYLESQSKVGMILPPMVTMGTVTRRAVEPTWLTASNAKPQRIGSELKAKICSPPGYSIIGADVDSQELWIASLLGDSQFGVHGSTAFGWMAVQGNKKDGTDPHSRSAKILKATRDHAKIFNYARIYGSGLKFSAALLTKCDPSVSEEEARKRAQQLYWDTKGRPFYGLKGTNILCKSATKISDKMKRPFWFGGSESYMFNAMEKIATQSDPRTPVLGCQMPDSLLSTSARKKYHTSCVNWVVQSSAVDYLHLLLVSCRHLMDLQNIRGRLLITIHDEIRYLVRDEDAVRMAMILQVANCWTRALFAFKLGMYDLPQSVAFFSAVDVDRVLRKEVFDKCITPSSPEGVLESGKSYSIQDLLNQLLPCDDNHKEVTDSSFLTTETMLNDGDELWLRLQMCGSSSEVKTLLTAPDRRSSQVEEQYVPEDSAISYLPYEKELEFSQNS